MLSSVEEPAETRGEARRMVAELAADEDDGEACGSRATRGAADVVEAEPRIAVAVEAGRGDGGGEAAVGEWR